MKKLTFSESVKQHYYVRRDECGAAYIALRGKKALGNCGLDHIYLISSDTVGLWVSSKQINRTIERLQSQVADLKVELLGDDEAVLSASISQLDALCRATGARVRPQLTDIQKQKLTERVKSFRFSKGHAKEKQKTV